MESTTVQEVENADSKECSVINNPRNTNILEQSRTDTSVNSDSKADISKKYDGENREEAKTVISVNKKKDDDAIAVTTEAFAHDNIETNAEIDSHKLTISDSEEQQSSNSSTSKTDVKFSEDNIEPKRETEINFSNIAAQDVNSVEYNVVESDPKESKGSKNAAAVITQQNYENTLRCKSNDLKCELIENHHEETEKVNAKDENAFDSSEDTSIEKDYSHVNNEENVNKLEEEEHKSYDINPNENEVATISDDDSFHSVSSTKSIVKLNSPHNLPENNCGETAGSKIIKLDKESDVINLEGECQDSPRSVKCFKSTSDSQDKEKYRSNIESVLIYNLENDDPSKDTDCEAVDQSIRDCKKEDIQLVNYSSDSEDEADERNVEKAENNQSGELFLRQKEEATDSKTSSSNADIGTELKVNGDHQMSPSTNFENKLDGNPKFYRQFKEEKINIKCDELSHSNDNDELERFDKAPLNTNTTENQELDEMDYDSDNKNETILPSQAKVIEGNLNQVNCDDENSHCSSQLSAESNSTDTSSLHQLVIDHPMEEMDVGVTEPYSGVELNPSSIQTFEKSEKSTMAKISLKRKRSYSSETALSPKHKQAHIELESDDNKNIGLGDHKIDSLNESMEEQQSKEISESNYSGTAFGHPPIKSLLLQHLQKPYTPPPPPDKPIELTVPNSMICQSLEAASFNNTPLTIPATVANIIESVAKPTKYLCFKCKSGSFNSFAALNEHQRECLADTRLLPARIAELGSLLALPLPPALTTPPPSASPEALTDIPITTVPTQTIVPTPVPQITTESTSQKKRYYKCSSCNTFHENWNLFLHIRDKHQRHMCLYCIRFFPTAEKLSVHLEIKHDLEQNHFNSEEALRSSVPIVGDVASETRFLMCCTCQHLFEESEPFSDHNCAEFMKPCTLCGQKGRHSNQCKAHPDAKRTSKTKKKLKKSAPVRSHNLLSSSFLGAPSNATSFNCDSNPISGANEIASAGSERAPVVPLHAEDSNSNSNMVIDESCTTTHLSLVNPFKELDERWRLEQQTQNQNGTNSLLPARNSSPTESKLTVPKFKLRVPKEFQKSVDMALSSTESEDDEDDEGNQEDDNKLGAHGETPNCKSDTSVAGTTLGSPNETTCLLQATNIYANDQKLSQKIIEDDNSQEILPVDKNEWVNEANPDLVRILQEIERTKLDIQRTKETLHHPPKAKPGPSDKTLVPASQNAISWTPTPPTSPKPAPWSTSEGSQSKMSPCAELVNPDPQVGGQPLQRRDSAGSDTMDIDETITGPTPDQPLRKLPEENLQQNNSTRQDLNTSSENNVSASLLNSSADSATSPTVRVNALESESPPLKQEQVLPIGESLTQINDQMQSPEMKESLPDVPADGIEVANEDILIVDLQLEQPLEKIEIVEFVRICLKAVYPICLFCNHARRIAVNGQSLVLHMLAQHRFSATVDSITAEELKPETICAKLKTCLPELESEFFNSTSYCTIGAGEYTHQFNERIFECFQCRFATSTHKELYLHNRKMHLKTAILCFMCRANFFSFSEILCHVCPGAPNRTAVFDVKFRCCLCNVDNIPSPFRLMVHLRKRHFACDVCLEDCRDQGRLSSHVWKHKLHHLCYRCGIAYRNKMDITKHLFWKHGTESIICKRCLQKRWRHVYHFCVPPSTFNCEVCNLCFSKAMYLKVHKRLHSGDLRYPCTEENCDEKFISRKLLLKHTETHLRQETLATTSENLRNFEMAEKITVEDKGSDEAKDGSDTEQDPNKNGSTIEIKKEKSGDSARETETPVKCEDIESSFKEKAEMKSDVDADMKNLDLTKGASTASGAEKNLETPRKKKKKNKRSKESLEDLNLIAPNLSETDSSDESDVDSKSRGEENSLVPKIMLSPPSEAENDLEEVKKADVVQPPCDDKEGGENGESGTGKVLEIWKKFLQAQQSSTGSEVGKETLLKCDADYDENNYPSPKLLHVAYSDHDYCQMFRPPVPVPPVTEARTLSSLPSGSPTKRNKSSKSPRRVSARRSASSSSSESSSSSDSSCSCGSNCSCSSSGSDSSSSSSSSDDSDSTAASNASRKRHRKKSERERLRKKSESVSPYKKHSNSETVNVTGDNLLKEIAVNDTFERPPSPPKEPQIYESDLETAESETDEEFYDEHPQKLASELLAQKRAQLMAQTRLSPSHNFDIVENSRPSTPSLPEDVVCETARVKLKKKKRDRKSSCKSSFTANSSSMVKAKNEKNNTLINIAPPAPISAMDRIHSYEFAQSSLTVVEPPMAQQPNANMSYSTLPLTAIEHLTPRPIAQYLSGRMSEGSSCSDPDGSLKRSKRARRPNKFYGYTSDDESAGINLGQPLMMGMRAIKPQPPPQLTWHKEDLPTPSKSILNQKNRTPRTSKTPGTPVSSDLLNSSASTSSKKKRAAENAEKLPARKRPSQKMPSAKNLPPIPTLKIRPSQLGISNDGSGSGTGTELIPTPQIYSSSKDTDDDDDDNNSEDSSDDETGEILVQTNVGQVAPTSSLWNNNSHTTTASPAINTPMLESPAPQPVLPTLPTPQATVFNHKIPPALLPNPNFETLQYFKANNIRYPIRPPAGARQAREGESVYCYCRCPYDEVSEMIACDGENCLIEWFHFECVGIMVAPQGKWFCAECRPKYSEELYPTSGNV